MLRNYLLIVEAAILLYLPLFVYVLIKNRRRIMKRMKRFISMLLAILILNLFIVQPSAAFQETTSLPMFQDNLETFISQSDISQLITPSAITSVSGDYIPPNDIHSSQWAIEKIMADLVWEFNDELLIHNNEVVVVVAVIDTGVD